MSSFLSFTCLALSSFSTLTTSSLSSLEITSRKRREYRRRQRTRKASGSVEGNVRELTWNTRVTHNECSEGRERTRNSLRRDTRHARESKRLCREKRTEKKSEKRPNEFTECNGKTRGYADRRRRQSSTDTQGRARGIAMGNVRGELTGGARGKVGSRGNV